MCELESNRVEGKLTHNSGWRQYIGGFNQIKAAYCFPLSLSRFFSFTHTSEAIQKKLKLNEMQIANVVPLSRLSRRRKKKKEKNHHTSNPENHNENRERASYCRAYLL